MKITADDLDNLRHMLGVDERIHKRNWGYRNYYAAGGGGSTVSMERLVAAGFAERGQQYHNSHVYHATLEGCKAIGLNAKQIERAMEP